MKEKSCLNEAEFVLLQRASLCQALLFLLFCKNESRSLIVHINGISLKASNTHFFARCGTFFSFPHFTCCQNSAAWQLVTATIASKKKRRAMKTHSGPGRHSRVPHRRKDSILTSLTLAFFNGVH